MMRLSIAVDEKSTHIAATTIQQPKLTLHKIREANDFVTITTDTRGEDSPIYKTIALHLTIEQAKQLIIDCAKLDYDIES